MTTIVTAGGEKSSKKDKLEEIGGTCKICYDMIADKVMMCPLCNYLLCEGCLFKLDCYAKAAVVNK